MYSKVVMRSIRRHESDAYAHRHWKHNYLDLEDCNQKQSDMILKALFVGNINIRNFHDFNNVLTQCSSEKSFVLSLLSCELARFLLSFRVVSQFSGACRCRRLQEALLQLIVNSSIIWRQESDGLSCLSSTTCNHKQIITHMQWHESHQSLRA